MFNLKLRRRHLHHRSRRHWGKNWCNNSNIDLPSKNVSNSIQTSIVRYSFPFLLMYSALSRITSVGVVFQTFVFLPEFFFPFTLLFCSFFFLQFFSFHIIFHKRTYSRHSMLFLLFAMHKNFWVTAKRCEYLDFCKSNEILVEEEKKKPSETNTIEFSLGGIKIIYFLLATLCARNTHQQQNKSTHIYTQIANGSRARSIYMFLREKKSFCF